MQGEVVEVSDVLVHIGKQREEEEGVNKERFHKSARHNCFCEM